jgi:hypothetical protein
MLTWTALGGVGHSPGMVEGASRHAERWQGGRQLRRVVVLGLLVVLGGCASSAEDGDGGGGGVSLPGGDGWRDDGGQTGSLTPRCGLPPLARDQSVSTATGIVVYTSDCPELSSGLGLFDADGNPVPSQTQPIGSGVVLVTPGSGVAPGSYTLGTAPAPGEDLDAGLDRDAGSEPGATVSDAGAAPVQGETITIREPSPAPTRLGDLQQPGDACSNLLELTLDAAVLPYLPSLALDVRVSQGGASVRLAAFGTLLVTPSRVVSIPLPIALLPRDGSSVRVSVEAVLASGAPAIVPATLDVSCFSPPRPGASPSYEDEDAGGCDVHSAGARSSSAAAAWLTTLFVLMRGWRRRRRRRPRPPD